MKLKLQNMKILNLIVICLITLLFSCKDDTHDIQPDTLIGTWEVRHILGVQVANAPSVFPKGNGQIIQFSASEYQEINDGKVISKGSYKIVDEQAAEIDGTTYTQRIVFEDKSVDWKVFIKLSGTKLSLCYGSIAHDGWTDTYEKIN